MAYLLIQKTLMAPSQINILKMEMAIYIKKFGLLITWVGSTQNHILKRVLKQMKKWLMCPKY